MPDGPRFEVERLKDQAVEDLRPALRVLLAAVIVVLLIVCANVANLLMAHGTARRRDMEVRLAVGATRARLVRQVLAECLLLSGAGGALGAAAGAGGIWLIKLLTTVEAPGIFRMMFGSTILPRSQEVIVDLSVLGNALGITAVATVLFGMVPAFYLSRSRHLHTGWRDVRRGESRARAALVVGQLTMATTLLVGASLLIQSFVRMSLIDSGYNPTNVLTLNLLLPAEYSVDRRVGTIESILTRLRETTNVRSVGFARHGVLIGEALVSNGFVPSGRSANEMRDIRARFRSVSDGFLTASGVSIISGREFAPQDSGTAPPVVVINRSAAQQYFGTTSAVGRTIEWHFREGRPRELTVIGVVEDVRQESPIDRVFPELFLDYRQFVAMLNDWGESPERQNELAIGFLSFSLLFDRDPSTAITEVRGAVHAVDSNVGIDGLVPLENLLGSVLARERFYSLMMGGFAVVAAALAVIGIYGVLAYTVTQRTREVGIRMALGAHPARIVALVLRQSIVLITVGIGFGLAGAAALTRYLEGFLFGVTPRDTATFMAVAVLFATVAMLASYIPARNAAGISPVVALRAE
jgi:putative ABC transport system permease protein